MANKENVQDVQFEEVDDNKKEKKSSKFKKVLGIITDAAETTGKLIWKNRGKIATGIIVYGATKVYDNVKKEQAVNKAWNVGCTTGRVSGKIEFNNSLTETEKREWYQDNKLNRDAFLNDDKLGAAIVDEIKARRNK
jgi:hypothetical protein